MSSTSKEAVTKTLEVGGTPFAYREVGPTTGVPVVFLHHFTAVLDDWDPAVVDGIAAERRVILVDLRGVGGSAAPPRTASRRWPATRSRFWTRSG
jgi:pimeloyl-ACP methyl ester carboxylesterase